MANCLQLRNVLCHRDSSKSTWRPPPSSSSSRINVVPVNSRANNPLSLNVSANSSSLKFAPLLKHRRRPSYNYRRSWGPVCSLGGKDKLEDDDKPSLLNLDEGMEGFKGKSLEDMLRQQMEERQAYGGGSGKIPPGGGGGGGGGDDDDDNWNDPLPEDEGFAGWLDETLQMTCATLALIAVYIYILSGEELVRLAKDYFRYVMGKKKSVRLRKAMKFCAGLKRRFTKKEKIDDPYWLERAILETPTLYDSPEKTRRILSSYLSSDDDDESFLPSVDDDDKSVLPSVDDDSYLPSVDDDSYLPSVDDDYPYLASDDDE